VAEPESWLGKRLNRPRARLPGRATEAKGPVRQVDATTGAGPHASLTSRLKDALEGGRVASGPPEPPKANLAAVSLVSIETGQVAAFGRPNGEQPVGSAEYLLHRFLVSLGEVPGSAASVTSMPKPIHEPLSVKHLVRRAIEPDCRHLRFSAAT
jgi:hypothetical protein